MPRITKEQKKKAEEKIIKYLLTKPNESIDRIAKKCGFSRQKAWRIIKRLEDSHTIWGYHAVVDDEKMNQKNYILLIKAAVFPAKNTPDRIIKREADKIAETLGVSVNESRYMHGLYDWIICFNAVDTKSAKKFTHMISKAYSEDIVDTILLEEMMPIKKCGFINPDAEKLKEFELFA
jgi:DNA-binding Lrp family transcriptional regulator